MSDRCKNCGYCPHCGRSDTLKPYPYVYPQPWGYPRAYWYANGGVVTASGTTSISAGPIQGSQYSRSAAKF